MRSAQFERTVETAIVGAYSKGGATRTRCSHIYDGFENPEGGGAEFWARATAFETISRGVEINRSAAPNDSGRCWKRGMFHYSRSGTRQKFV